MTIKSIITGEKVFKASMTADGQLSVNILNGKSFTAQLTPNELEQMLFRISESSQGVLSFDPAPSDYVGMHENDVKTLEAQSLAINELREQLEEAKQASKRHDQTITELNEANFELEKVKKALREANLVIEKQAQALAAVSQPSATKNESAEEQPTDIITPPAGADTVLSASAEGVASSLVDD